MVVGRYKIAPKWTVFGVNDYGLFIVQREIGPTTFSHIDCLGEPPGIIQSDPENFDLGPRSSTLTSDRPF